MSNKNIIDVRGNPHDRIDELTKKVNELQNRAIKYDIFLYRLNCVFLHLQKAIKYG